MVCYHNEVMTTKSISRQSVDASKAITIVRLSLQGALVGAALVGLFTQAQHYDVVGAIIGGIAVFIAKIKHVF